MLTPAAIGEAVDLLIAARGDHRRLEAFPASCRPATIADGYAIQEAFAEAWGAPVAGYKVGATTPEIQKALGTPGPFPGRVFAPVRLDSPALVSAKAFHKLGIEPEFAFTLARDLPPRTASYTRADVTAAIAALHPAIEIIDTRWVDIRTAGGAALIADNGAQGALVLGPGLAEWRRIDLPKAAGTLLFDGKKIAEGTGAAVMGDPLEALVWLANDLAQRGFGLKRGDAATTGTIAGVNFATAGMHVVADFGPLGRVELRVGA